MTTAEHRGYLAGLSAAATMAAATAETIEARADAGGLRQRVAAETLRGLAEALVSSEGITEIVMSSAGGTQEGIATDDTRRSSREWAETGPPNSEPSPVRRALRIIAEIPGASGEIECPACKGRLRWTRAESNGHVHGTCETKWCLSWMQ